MTDDELFRWIMLGGLVAVLPFGIYFRVRAHGSGEKLDRLQEGMFLLIGIRLAGLATMTGLVLYMIDPALMAWSSLPLPVWLRWCGVAIAGGFSVLLFFTYRNLGKNLTDTVVTRKEHTLVTTGPYRWVRHPFYVCIALAVIANALVAANWYIFAAGALLFTLLAIRVRKEEARLIERFGDDYRALMARTWRFFPKLPT